MEPRGASTVHGLHTSPVISIVPRLDEMLTKDMWFERPATAPTSHHLSTSHCHGGTPTHQSAPQTQQSKHMEESSATKTQKTVGRKGSPRTFEIYQRSGAETGRVSEMGSIVWAARSRTVARCLALLSYGSLLAAFVKCWQRLAAIDSVDERSESVMVWWYARGGGVTATGFVVIVWYYTKLTDDQWLFYDYKTLKPCCLDP